jgi:rhodanese-related sulfurtransferase
VFPPDNGCMKSITVQQLQAREDTPLIDVREVDEFAAGHVPGAVNLPMSRIGELLDQLPDGAFDVICQAGGRSARVVEALEAQGYDATNVEGGTGAWIASGLPVDK